jgi:cobalt/nickel transport system ATP-binding protein
MQWSGAMTPVLDVAHLSFGYDGVPVLRDLSFAISAGEAVGIVGANGSGKSTLLWCIAGLLRGEGEVRLFGQKPGREARSRLGMVFQNPEDQLFMPSLGEDLVLPLLNQGTKRPAAEHAAAEALRQFGLERFADRPATHLSLGQRKRAAIALALVRRPELLLLDEPTAELDGRAVRQLQDTLRGIETARLIASHHLEFLRVTTSRVLVLAGGAVVADGPTAAILDDRNLLDDAGLI